MINIIEEIEHLLAKLNTEFEMQAYSGKSDEYIIFDIYNEKDTDLCNKGNLTTTYYITLNYWHKDKSCRKKYDIIKKLFKDNSFFFDSAKTLKSENLIGKNFTFIKKIINESEEK